MIAAWYERRGPAHEVLQVGEAPDPEPAPGEVLVRMTLSGVNPGDTKKRGGYFDAAMPFPRVVPHSDGAGVVEAAGDGVDPARVGTRVWVWGAQSYRADGTAAQLVCPPQRLAVDLPDTVADEQAACWGIPGITAHRAVFAGGPVAGRTVLVHGVLGGVGSLAAQLAHWAGARVVGTVRRAADLASLRAVHPGAAWPVVALDDDRGAAAAVRAAAGGDVDRVVEVSLSDNVDLDAEVLGVGGSIAAYATREARTAIPFWPMLFDNLTVQLLGSDDFPVAAREQAVRDLTEAGAAGALHCDVQVLPLDRVADAHELVDAGTRRRVLLLVPHDDDSPGTGPTDER